MRRNLLASVALLALAACAQLGLAPAQTFDQKLAYAYGTHTAIVASAAQATKTGTLNATDAEHVLTLADQSRQFLDAAHAVETSNVNDASAKLALATAILNQLTIYLQAQGVK